MVQTEVIPDPPRLSLKGVGFKLHVGGKGRLTTAAGFTTEFHKRRWQRKEEEKVWPAQRDEELKGKAEKETGRQY